MRTVRALSPLAPADFGAFWPRLFRICHLGRRVTWLCTSPAFQVERKSRGALAEQKTRESGWGGRAEVGYTYDEKLRSLSFPGAVRWNS
jgi:hypothetical protein